MKEKLTRKQITVAVSGNKFGNSYARGGVDGYYSTWTIKMTLDNSGYIHQINDVILKKFNLSKNEVPQKYFDNYEIFNNMPK